MGLFDDDFYSTKVSRRIGWRQLISSRRRLPGWMMPAAGGAAVMAALFLLFGGSGSDEAAPQDSPTVATMAPLPGADTAAGLPAYTVDPVVAAAAKVSPAVVSILGLRQEMENDPDDYRSGAVGIGSGVIFERAGGKARIVTNNHVVEGFTKLDVVTAAGDRRKAELIGRDQISDLAVLEIDGDGIVQIAEFGDSDALRTGETAIALGNPLGIGYAPTVTRGIISYPKRTIPVSLGRGGTIDWEMEVIQTDAAINQGNSGGALVNLEGKVIGINTLKVSDMGVEGLGFAIPVNQAKTIIDTLIKEKKVKRPFIGIVTQELQSYVGTESLKLPSDVKRGIIVLEATGPAKAAGLKTNDVIVELDGQPTETMLALRKYIYGSKQIGEKLTIGFYREGKKHSAEVTLEELKE